MSDSGAPDPGGADRRTTLAGERTELAGERTSLAGERTMLAWWRTGLTAIAVALGVGRLLPALGHHRNQWPYVFLGIGFALYGIGMFLIGTRRMGVFDRAARAAGEPSVDDRLLIAVMGGGVVLGIATLALIAAQ
jgi:putative membrane protein